MNILKKMGGQDWSSVFIEFATLSGFVSRESVDIDFYPDKPITLFIEGSPVESERIGDLLSD